MSEKVRHYLEQSLGEIEDLKKREIFTEDELHSIIKRRTDYEHRLLARNVKPSEFMAYANYEINVEKLRKLRVNRMKKQGNLKGTRKENFMTARRINFIFERATRRFPSNLGLWTKAVDFARSQKMVNVVNKELTQMLRLHPTEPEVWVYVAKYQAENNSSIVEARAVLQKGLRFNPDSPYLWLEYMRLELIYVAKILARRKLLGISRAQQDEKKELESNDNLELTGEDLNEAEREIKNLPDINMEILGDAKSNPVLRGDVALVVFDAATAQKFDKREFCVEALKIIDEFTALDRLHLANHVIEWATSNLDTAESWLWSVTLPVRYVSVEDPEFPDQLRQMFAQYNKVKKPGLAQLLRDYLADNFLSGENGEKVDGPLRKAIELFVKKL